MRGTFRKKFSLTYGKLVIVITTTFLIATLLTSIFVYSNPSSITIEPASFVETASYVIWKDGSTYKAKNGETGAITSNNDDEVLIQNCIDTLTASSGGLIFVRSGSYSASVTVKSNVVLMLEIGVTGLDYTTTGTGIVMSYVNGYAWIDAPLNMTGHQIVFALFHSGTSFPSSPSEAQWFYRTDLHILYVWNSTAWVNCFEGGTGATHVAEGDYSYLVYKDGSTIYMKNGSTEFNDWSSTNARVIFEACIGNLTEGGSIFVKRGTYLFDNEITSVNDNITFISDSSATTIFKVTGEFDCFDVDDAQGLTFENIQFDMADAASWTAGLRFDNCTDITVESCLFIDNGIVGSFRESTVQNCEFKVGNIYLLAGTNDNLISDNSLEGPPQSGLNMILIGGDPTEYNLATNASSGQPNITISDASSYSTGMCIKVLGNDSNGASYGAYGTKEIQRISSVSGNTITCDTNLRFNYSTINDAYVELACPRNKILNNKIINGAIKIGDNNDDCIIDGNFVDASYSMNGWGIYGYTSDNVIMTNNIMIGSNSSEVVGGHGTDFAYSDNLIRANNFIYGFHTGMTWDGTVNGIVTGNIIVDCVDKGIDLQFATPPMRKMIVSNNIISGCAEAISMTGARNHIVTGNLLFGNDKAIKLWGNCYSNIITDNLCIDNEEGISISANAFNLIANNRVVNNTKGIIVWGGWSNEITDNMVENTEQHGMLLYNADNNTIANNRIVNSDYKDTTSYNGIKLYGDSDENIIKNNIIWDSDNYEILLESDCNDNEITYNDLRGTDHQDYVSDSGTNTIFKYNLGYVTENSGTATNTTATTFVFNHGLAVTPLIVFASFNTTAVDGWTWTATSTQITITVTGTLPEYMTVYWYARTWVG